MVSDRFAPTQDQDWDPEDLEDVLIRELVEELAEELEFPEVLIPLATSASAGAERHGCATAQTRDETTHDSRGLPRSKLDNAEFDRLPELKKTRWEVHVEDVPVGDVPMEERPTRSRVARAGPASPSRPTKRDASTETGTPKPKEKIKVIIPEGPAAWKRVVPRTNAPFMPTPRKENQLEQSDGASTKPVRIYSYYKPVMQKFLEQLLEKEGFGGLEDALKRRDWEQKPEQEDEQGQANTKGTQTTPGKGKSKATGSVKQGAGFAVGTDIYYGLES